MSELRIGKAGRKTFTLPLDIAGEAIAVLAKRGAGKSNTAAVIAEELIGAGVQVVILDPVGAHWGLRYGRDGKTPGLAIPILGGQHGDVPLEESAGHLIADVLVDSGSSALLDLSDFETKAAANRFVTDFAKRLYYRKGRSPSVLHLLLEEAHQFVPQATPKGETHMKSAFERVIGLGRQRGIGITMVSQRSAKLNKDALTQADTLVAMRTVGPHDRKAIQAWIDYRGEDAKAVMASIPGLETGEAWFWNPERDLLERVQVRLCSTYDSRRQAKPGEERAMPTAAATIDLDALGEQIVKTSEKAKANDPKALKRELAKTKAEIRRLQRETPAADPAAIESAEQRGRHSVAREYATVAKSHEAKLKAVARQATKLQQASVTIGEAAAAIAELCQNGDGGAAPVASKRRPVRTSIEPEKEATATAGRRNRARRAPESPVALESGYSSELTRRQQDILDTLAQLDALGVPTAHRTIVAALAGVSPRSSAYDGNLRTLKNEHGMIDYPDKGLLALTSTGHDGAQAPDVPTSLAALHGGFKRHALNDAQAVLLDVLIGCYPDDISREHLANDACVSIRSSAFDGNLRRLKTLGAATYPERGRVVATDLLFPEGLY